MKIKVLMMDLGGWGGITHYTYNLMQALSGQPGLECVLLTDRDYELDDLPRNFKVIKLALKNRPYLFMAAGLIRAVMEFKPGIIHVQTMLSARKDWLLFLFFSLCGIKIVFTAHNVMPHEDIEKKAFFMKTAFGLIYSVSRVIIVHSNFSREGLIGLFGVPGDKIWVIPHGNYLFFRTREVSRQEARQKLNIGLDKKIVLHFGALRHYKGIETLLNAMSLLCSRHSEVMLLLAGNPMNVPEGYFPRLIAQHRLDKHVILKAGYIPAQEIPDIFFASDLAVLPYKHIDTSGSIQMAYAFSKPVVASRTGSMPEVLDDNVNGVLVPPDDPQVLSGAMEKILFDPQALERMGAASLALARDRFSWQAIAQKTGALYKEVGP